MSGSSGGSAPAASSASPVPAPTAAPPPPTTLTDALTLFVQVFGDRGWGEVVVASTVSVARLIEEAAKKLPSIQGKDVSKVFLHVADESPDGKYIVRVDALPSRMKLVDAGVKDGMSIVVKADAAAAAAGTSRPGAGEVDFETLLQQAGVTVNDAVVKRAATTRAAEVAYCEKHGRPDYAKIVYDKVAALPLYTTMEELGLEGYQLDGPLPENPDMIVGYRGWEDRLIKPLPSRLQSYEHSRIIVFEAAVKSSAPDTWRIEGGDLLWAAPNLAPFRLYTEHTKDKSFIIMPRYRGTLEPRTNIAPADAERIWRDVSACLKGLHDRGFAHMDIKAANVCTTESGCVVIDHGSIVKFGRTTATTKACIPRDISEGARRASAAMDWWMFAMLLAEKACGTHSIKIGSRATSPPSMKELREHLVTHCVLSAEAKAALFRKLELPFFAPAP